MDNLQTRRLVLPFQARDAQTRQLLSLDQALQLMDSGRVLIERSYPGAPQAAGWTVFYRQPLAYTYLGDPLFATQQQAQRYFRQTYQPEVPTLDELYPPAYL
jgi:hypothetical protein